MTAFIDCDQLETGLAEGPTVLIDVLTGDHFDRSHIPGAVNICVYKVSFGEEVRKAVPDTDTPLVICDAEADTRGAEMAVRKLTELGYRDIAILEGGLKEWVRRGKPQEGSGDPEPDGLITGDRSDIKMNLEKSHILWTGRNLVSRHDGTLSFSDANVHFLDGTFSGGTFEIDMQSIHCLDLKDEVMNQTLVHHLKSDDFFDVRNHPSALCRITRVKAHEPSTPGLPDIHCEGGLTLKGITNPVDFDAITGYSSANEWVFNAHFDIDRTEWDVAYGSGKWFRHLGMHLVHDRVSLQVLLVSEPLA